MLDVVSKRSGECIFLRVLEVWLLYAYHGKEVNVMSNLKGSQWGMDGDSISILNICSEYIAVSNRYSPSHDTLTHEQVLKNHFTIFGTL